METYEFIKLPNGTIQVNASKCGQLFEGIVLIHFPDSPNPLIEIPRPLGMAANIQILFKVIEKLSEQEDKYPIGSSEHSLLLGSQMALGSSHCCLSLFQDYI